MSPRATTLFVVGMGREARILGSGRRVLVGAAGLARALEDRPDAVISFGLCGALDPALGLGDLVVASAVLSHGSRIPTDEALGERLARLAPRAKRGAVWGSDGIVGEARAKAGLAASGAIAVDMESHLVAARAAAAGIPFAVVRAVSDRAQDTLPLAAQAGFRPDGGVDIGAVILSLARRPWELPALIATARHAEAGFKALGYASEALRALGPA